MTATRKSGRPADRLRRRLRWLALGAGFGLAPKCLFCLAGYLGLGAALGLRVPALCGATGSPPRAWALIPIACATLGVAGLRRSRTRSPSPSRAA